VPFVGAIIAAIASAIATIGSIIETIAAAIGAAIGSAGAAIGGLLESVFSSIASSVGGTLGALFKISGIVLGDIDSTIISTLGVIAKVVETVNGFLQGILKPIQDLMTSISGIFTAIQQDYQAVTTLVNELHADLHSGIQGLLEIPTTISDALTSVESTTMRALETINKGTADTTKNILIPGMSDAIGNPLKDLGQQFSWPANTDYDLTRGIDEIKLGVCGVSDYVSQNIARIQKALTTPATLLDYLGKVVSDVGWLAVYLEAAVVSDIECIRQGARQANPSELLGIGDTLEALYRGILDETDAQSEVMRRGLSKSRFKVLKENAQWLPGLREALLLMWRGLIKTDEYLAICEKLHMTKADATAMMQMVPEPIDPREYMALSGRVSAQDAGFLPKTLGDVVPKEIEDQYLRVSKDPQRAQWDWQGHWMIPDLDWWLTAYVRGLINADDFKNAAVAKNMPEEILDKILPVYQETIQLWMVPDILATGMLTEAEAKDYLAYIGVGPRDADLLIKWGLTKAKLPVSVQAQQLMAISVGNAREMYIDRMITRDTFIEILTAHQYTQEAAVLTAALVDQEQSIAARKQYVTNLITEVDAGLKTPQQLSDEMHGAGYSQDEILAALEKIKASVLAKTKQPTKGELTDFLRYGVIAGDTYVQSLISLGYTPSVALDFYNLEVAQHGEPSQPISTGSTSTS